MADKYITTKLKKDSNDFLWLWNYIYKIRIKTGYKIKELIHWEKSKYQEIAIVDTKGFGRILLLDGTPQMTTCDGFIYNEMISHVPLVTHPNPQKVCVIGGADCGPAREAMKYSGIKQIDTVEIDERVTEVCRTYLTPNSYYVNDARFRMVHRDGFDWLYENKKTYDVIMIDRPDPYGPAKKLYESRFYKHIFNALTDDGVVVFQSGSPFYNQSTLCGTVGNLRDWFPVVRTYLASIPIFPSGIWSFTLASKKYDPLTADLSRLKDSQTKYIDSDVFSAAFVLPKYVRELVK